MKRQKLKNGFLRKVLLEEDVSDLTPREIAEVYQTTHRMVLKELQAIRKETGCPVPHVDGRKVRWYDDR